MAFRSRMDLRRYAPLSSVLLAGTLWGVISLFIRPLSRAGFTMGQVVFLRSLVSVAAMGVLLGACRPSLLRVRWRDLWYFVGTGAISIYCFSWCYFQTIAMGYAAVGGVLLYTSPAFVMILSRILFREALTLRKLLALGLIFVGSILVSGMGSHTGALPPRVVLCGIASGFLYALYSIFATPALRKYSVLTLLFYTFLFATLAGAVACHPTQIVQLLQQNPTALLDLAGAGVLCTALPYFFYSWGMARTTPAKAAILVAVEPLVCTLLGAFAYHETMTLPRWTGAATILTAILLLAHAPHHNDE